MGNRLRFSIGITLMSVPFLTSCGLERSSLSPEGVPAQAIITDDDVLDLLRVALQTTMSNLGHDKRFPRAQIVIMSDYAPKSDPLERYGLSTTTMNRLLAADLHFIAKPRDEMVSCFPEYTPTGLMKMNPCSLITDGVFYALTVDKLGYDYATVGVSFMTKPGNSSGTYVLDLKRSLNRWEVVATGGITS